MIGKISKGKGFGGAARYVLGKEGAEYLGGTFEGQTWDDIRPEVKQLHAFMSAKKTTFHASISLGDNERLTDDQWRDASAKYLEGIGLQNTPHLVVRHTDTKHDHIHIVALRLDMETLKAPTEWKDFERTERVLRGLEEDFGLRKLPEKKDREGFFKAPAQGEIKRDQRLGIEPRERIEAAFEQVLLNGDSLSRPKTLPAFAHALEAHGVRLEPHIQSTGRLSGLKYTDLQSNISIKASKLGKAFGPKLLDQKMGITYRPTRDAPYFKEDPERRVVPLPQPASPAPSQTRTRSLEPPMGDSHEAAQRHGAPSKLTLAIEQLQQHRESLVDLQQLKEEAERLVEMTKPKPKVSDPEPKDVQSGKKGRGMDIDM